MDENGWSWKYHTDQISQIQVTDVETGHTSLYVATFCSRAKVVTCTELD